MSPASRRPHVSPHRLPVPHPAAAAVTLALSAEDERVFARVVDRITCCVAVESAAEGFDEVSGGADGEVPPPIARAVETFDPAAVWYRERTVRWANQTT